MIGPATVLRGNITADVVLEEGGEGKLCQTLQERCIQKSRWRLTSQGVHVVGHEVDIEILRIVSDIEGLF